MRPVGFKPTVSAVERPQIQALDLAVTGTSIKRILKDVIQVIIKIIQREANIEIGLVACIFGMF
jgi:hypothetical protein